MEHNTLKSIKKEKKNLIKEKFHNKLKRGAPWRLDETDIKLSTKITEMFTEENHQITDFIHKNRQILLQNRKNMFHRGQAMHPNEYTKYNSVVYNDQACKLCDKNIIDDSNHWYSCEYSKPEWDLMNAKIMNILTEHNIKNFKMWFGINEEVIDDDNLPIKEQRLLSYDKKYGNRFFIPKAALEIIKEKNKKEGKKILYKIIKIQVTDNWNIYRNRIKAHGEKMKSKELKRKYVQDKFCKLNEEDEIFLKKLKWNEEIDLTGNTPCIVTDLTCKKKRKKCERKKKTNKKAKTNITISDAIPHKTMERIMKKEKKLLGNNSVT